MFQRGRLGEVPLTAATAPQYYEEPAEYVYEVSLTALQALVDQSRFVDSDADFMWMAVKGNATGDYSVRFRMPNGRYIQNAQVNADNAIGTAQFPVPVGAVAVPVPAAGRIGIDITDLSNAPNTVQLVFMGVRRYPVR